MAPIRLRIQPAIRVFYILLGFTSCVTYNSRVVAPHLSFDKRCCRLATMFPRSTEFGKSAMGICRVVGSHPLAA
jgi:hypothetical protein